MIFGAWLTSLLCLLLPPFSVAAVFIMPLFLCPLAGSKKEVWAYPVGLAAILLGASLWTRQVFFPVWLLLAIAPPLVLAYRFPHMKLEFRQFLFWFVGAYALSAVMVLAWPVMAGLGSPAEWISARLVELLCAKNEHELRKAALQAGADEAGADALCGLLTLHGPFGATLTAAKAAAISPSQKAALAELLALQNALGEAGRGLQLDLSMADEAEYYNGIVFTGYAAGIPRAVLKGGQYDYLMQRFTPGAKAIGFAMYLDELERLLPPVQQQGGEKIWLNIALPKGRLGDKAYALLAGAGYSANEDYNDTRKLVVENPEAGVRYFLVKPSDVAIYVEHGAADIGIVGKDILAESGADVYELLDTGMGKCRMCVAGPRNFVDDESRALRVATKFVNIARAHYESIGRDIDIIKLNGSIELAPILGLSDVIVDIVETGTTLKENNLAVLEEFMPISARFIANKASYKFKYAQLTELLNKMKEALAK